jgi:hypothetical protein
MKYIKATTKKEKSNFGGGANGGHPGGRTYKVFNREDLPRDLKGYVEFRFKITEEENRERCLAWDRTKRGMTRVKPPDPPVELIINFQRSR